MHMYKMLAINHQFTEMASSILVLYIARNTIVKGCV